MSALVRIVRVTLVGRVCGGSVGCVEDLGECIPAKLIIIDKWIYAPVTVNVGSLHEKNLVWFSAGSATREHQRRKEDDGDDGDASERISTDYQELLRICVYCSITDHPCYLCTPSPTARDKPLKDC